MIVYLFGNGFSFVVVIYGFRKIVKDGEDFDLVVKEFVKRNFCVDDGFVLRLIVIEIIKLVRDI